MSCRWVFGLSLVGLGGGVGGGGGGFFGFFPPPWGCVFPVFLGVVLLGGGVGWVVRLGWVGFLSSGSFWGGFGGVGVVRGGWGGGVGAWGGGGGCLGSASLFGRLSCPVLF
ncbi:unnamed protein product [Dicrocoelium dendriticum]|nr:unnamed protein product [Dicrocoelium dendriticum]